MTSRSLPSQSERPTAEQIREWESQLRAGGSVLGGRDLSYVFAVVRRINGIGVDHTDPDGEQARAYVDEVLG